MIEQVYNRYYDTTGNYHWIGVLTGEHIVRKGEKMTRDEAIKILNMIPTIGEQVDALEIAIRSLEAWESLYEKTAEWEAEALHMVDVHSHDEDNAEWKRWSTILTERSAFKFDIADSPTADVVPTKFHDKCMEIEIQKRMNMVERKQGKNISKDGFLCSVCTFGDFGGFHGYEPNYCPNCGADMRG